MKIVLPWPDSRLNPNARVHWRALSAVKALAREDARKLARGAMVRFRRSQADYEGAGRISYIVAFYPPDARHRDDDNMIASFKAARDGIAEAMGVNDRRFAPHYFFRPPEKHGRVEVEIG